MPETPQASASQAHCCSIAADSSGAQSCSEACNPFKRQPSGSLLASIKSAQQRDSVSADKSLAEGFMRHLQPSDASEAHLCNSNVRFLGFKQACWCESKQVVL